MSESEALAEMPFNPIFTQSRPNDEILLDTAKVNLRHGTKTTSSMARISMKFIPDERLDFFVPYDENCSAFEGFGIANQTDGCELVMTDRNVTVPVLFSQSSSEIGGTRYLPQTSPVLATVNSHSIKSATFHVFNFPRFFGTDDFILKHGEEGKTGSGWKRIGRVILKGGGWLITLTGMSNTDELEKLLKSDGGYVITHIGRIEKEDGSQFTSESLRELFECLQYFCSFALGRWSGVSLPVGFDDDGNQVFEMWGLGWCGRGVWNGGLSWFSDHHAEMLSEVFPGFFSRWTDTQWREALRSGLYFYLAACDRVTGIGIDTSLIIAQSALEQIAWTYCVKDQKMISEKAFKRGGLAAADKLRLLVFSLGIPLALTPTLSASQSKGQRPWTDGLDAITEIRNSIVHPDANRSYSNQSTWNAWLLSLWYLDLILLRLCGHAGKYSNRLKMNRWAGEVEAVPWSQS